MDNSASRYIELIQFFFFIRKFQYYMIKGVHPQGALKVWLSPYYTMESYNTWLQFKRNPPHRTLRLLSFDPGVGAEAFGGPQGVPDSMSRQVTSNDFGTSFG